jgi:hypothetical protein
MLVAGEAYATWEQAVNRQHSFTACIVRSSRLQDGTVLKRDATRFVLLLQRGWTRNVLVERTCGASTEVGDVEHVVAVYLQMAVKDPRKLIARYFRSGSVVGHLCRGVVAVRIIMGIEAAGLVLVPIVRGPYLLWP